MKQKIHYLFMLLLMMIIGVGGVKADEVKYKISSKNSLTIEKGTAPEGSSATIVETYGTSCQMTSGNSQTLTLKGYEGYKITKLVLSMKSNKSSGSGYLFYSTDGGTTFNSIVGNTQTNAGPLFSDQNWHGSWSTSYVDVAKSVDIECGNSDVVFKLHATGNSLYCQSYTITYQKVGTSLKDADLSFESTTATATYGESFTAPTLSNPNNLSVSYTSSNTGVAKVDATTGAVTLVGAGTTTITASSKETETYAAGEASYELTVNPAPVEGQLFYESFNKFNGTGGNDNQWSGSIASAAWGDTDNDGWTNEKGYSAKQCAKFGASSALGKATTPTISIPSGNATLTFKAAAWSGDAATLNLSVSDGSITPATITMKSGEWSEYTIAISGTQETTITFEGNTASKSRFFLDEVRIVEAPAAAVESPTFSVPEGTYFEAQTVTLTCATEDAAIYYTLDGTEPTAESTEYTGAISISETTTLKAIAVKDGQFSNVASATYTFPKVYTLGEMNAQPAGTYNVKFDKAVVTYVNGRFVFIEDATGAILFYNKNTYAEKQVLDGIASVTWTLFSGQPEATAITEVEGATFTTDGTVESVSPNVVTLAELLEHKDAYISRFIKVEHVNAEASDKISQGDCELAFYGRNKAAVETGNIYDITGFLGIHQDEDADAIYQLVAYTPDHVTEISTVAQVGTKKYETLEAAFAAAEDGATVTVLSDCAGNGIFVNPGKYATGLTVDFGGHTYTVDGTTVGSAGTETQAFHLEKDNKITFKNGTITSENAKMLIQNYSDLTLEGMTLTLNNANYASAYTLSNNNGNVVIDGTTINANPAGAFAFDVCRYASYPSVNVEVKGESVINGNIEISASGNDAKDGFGLTLTAGTLNGNIVLDASAAAAMESTPDKVSITKADAFETAAPADYKWVASGEGTSKLAPCEYVAQVGEQKYETLEEAWAEVKDGDTIKLLADCEGNGLIAPQGKFTSGLIVDFNGKTYSVTGNLVGSTGTESQAFQLLKENKITFKNGTITSAKAKILIQNYSDLTLEGMTLTMNNANYASAYTLSNNNGNIVIDGTTINANEAGGFAFDVCRYSSYPSVNVEVKGESVINGNIEISASGNDAKDGFGLTLTAGTLNGNIVLDASAAAAMESTPDKVSITKADAFETAAPEGYKWVAAGEGTQKLVPCEYVAQIGEGENVKKYETLEEAWAEVKDGETIKLLADCEGNGLIAPQGKFTSGLIVDFNGKTYSVTGNLVGSTGTESQAFQLLKDNKITFKGGTIYSEKALFLVQNYSDLTLEGMTLTLNNANYASAYTLSNNNGNVVIDGTTINANEAGGFAFDVCRYASYPSVNVEVKGESVINGNIEISASGNDAKDGFGLTLTAGTLNGNIVLDASAAAAMESTPDKVSITKADAFETAAPEGYEWANNGDGTSTLQPVAPVVLSAPIIFHDDGGEYEGELTVAIAGEGTIKYQLGNGAEQTYSAPFTISDEGEYTIKAWAEKDGVKSDEVTKTFTIVEKAKGAVVEDGYYTIQTNDGKYVNVAGRKTVTLVNDTKSAGTVIRVKADEDGVKVLRSQAVDLPRYAERAMSYVPEIVKEVVKKLAANVDDPIIGEQGADLILDKFKKEFDYHLYLEGENNTYRIYGRTPSMKPVVDFYAENKQLVDSRLPKLEGFVEEILLKVAERLQHPNSDWAKKFKVHNIWALIVNEENKLTEPVDEASTAKFFTEVLSSEANIWNFAHETAMIYWTKVEQLINNPDPDSEYADMLENLGDYKKYLEKVPNIRPNFKYYIVPGENGVDIISEGNSQITDASTAWTLTKRDGFDVTFDATLSKNNGKEMYKTLYVDFGYKLPDGVTALKVTAIDENTGVAKTEEIGQEVAPQTPVLLKSDKAGDITLTIGDIFGSAVTDNQLVGADYLINKYEINTPQVESIITLLANLSKSLADEYSYLKRKNAGTVNNKYFFGLTEDDVDKCTELNEAGKKTCVIRSLSTGDQQTGFYNNWEAKANQAFLVTKDFNPVKLMLKGDVNRDGKVSVADVNALVEIVLGKVTEADNTKNYDFEAAHVNADKDITIADVTALVNIILGKTQN